MKKRRIKPFSLLLDLITDAALIGMGLLFYYHFEVHPLGPFDLGSEIIDLFGSRHNAALTISLVPLVIGGLSFLQTIIRTFKGLFPLKGAQSEG